MKAHEVSGLGGSHDPSPPPSIAVDLKTAARMLGVCKKTLERLRDSGELRCLRIGNRWRVRVDELHAFLRRQEVKT